MNTKKEVFGIELKYYLNANKEEKGKILDGLERQTGMHRISIIRRFTNAQIRSPGYNYEDNRGRPVYYTQDSINAFSEVWKTTDFACAELLHPLIPERVEIFKRDKMWNHSDEATKKLLEMSVGKMKLIIPKMRTFPTQRGISTTTPSAIKDKVPLFEGSWKKVGPGNGQIDTVAHCGGSLAGEFIFSCGYVDVCTGWFQYKAQWNKTMNNTKTSLKEIKKLLPFNLKMIHPDCGKEFLNQFVMQWAEDNQISVTRSRSYHKNDNGYIEQRNGHIVRRWLCYERLERKKDVDRINIFYDKLCLFYNHFQAQRLCIGTKVSKIGKVRKVYEKIPLTPYQRILGRTDIEENTKNKIKNIHQKLNPKLMHQELEKEKYAILNDNLIHNRSGKYMYETD